LLGFRDVQTARVIHSRSDPDSDKGDAVRTDLGWWFNDFMYSLLVLVWSVCKLLPEQRQIEGEGLHTAEEARRIADEVFDTEIQ